MILSPALPSQPALWPSLLAILAYFFAAAWPGRPQGGLVRHERPIWAALLVGWLAQAVAIVLQDRKASISYVQRKLKIGYNRAARLLEDMENAGLVSALTSSGQRDILVAPRGD